MHDLSHMINTVQTLNPVGNRTGNETGSTVDTRLHDAATFVVTRGTWTDGTHTFTFEHAADDGNGSPDVWEAVADADLVGSEPEISDGSNDGVATEVGYTGSRRFLRASVATSGTTTGAEYAVHVMLGRGRHQPI